ALQPDGKIVVAGVAVTSTRDNDFAVARYNPNGSVDTSFGGTGTITINISGRVASTDWARGVVVQADGKIVVVGYTQASGSLSSGVAIVRLKADGTLDPTFGVSGVLTSVDSVKNKMAHAVALQRDGKIVIAGSVNCISRYVAGYCTLVERYNTDGSRDGTFSGPGVDLVDDATLGAQGLVLQGDGKIVVVGTQNRGNGNELSVARYGANGSIDATFGQSGVSMVPIGMDVGSSNTGTSIALQADGKIVVAGEAHTDAANNHFSVTRLLSSGAVDTGFGNAGSVVTNVAVPPESDYPWVVSVQPDGKILLAGERTIARTNPWPLPGVYRAANVDFAAVRYTAAGTLDALFGVGGIVTTDVRSFEDRVHAMAVQADGSIVFAGESFINDSSNTSGGYTSFSLVRVKSNGSLDAGFGSGH
ncbi:MAG TPA: hypothetical protein VEA41_09545, partial [Salinarimonas sp.]|nr:hypothetical protein [Salinarimonas sp.]